MVDDNSENQDTKVSDATTVKRILNNALDHFSKYGYTGASVREITQASQVTKPTLYYYFKNKEELYLELAKSCFQEILERLAVAASRTGSLSERVLNVIREYCTICDDRRCVARFVFLMTLTPDRGAPKAGVDEFHRQVGAHFRQILTDGVSNGEMKEELIDTMIYSIYGVFYLRISNMLANEPIPHDFALVENSIRRILRV